MLSISKEANPNYLAKLVVLKGLKKHPNADKLQVAMIDFQQVITDMTAQENDVYVFFPLECVINHDFLSATNSFRHSHLNKIVDDENCGFFEDKGRVKAVKLRGEKSMGYLVPAPVIQEFTGYEFEDDDIGKEFDTIGKILMLKKYELPKGANMSDKKFGKKPRISRLVDGQVYLHVDTEQLRKNIHKIGLHDEIAITYKLHGTSFWVSNVLGKKKLNLFYKFLKFIGISIQETEYDYFYGSRKVVKNQYETQDTSHFYEYDLWGDIKEAVKDKIPKGFSLYGECVGFTKNGGYIQMDYDYGCEPCQNKIYIYRITFTNADGIVSNLSTSQMVKYCERFGLDYVPLLYKGTLRELLDIEDADLPSDERDLNQLIIKTLEEEYTEKDCYICKNKVPEEGVVLKKESMFEFESYKLKSFSFLQKETELLDKGVIDLESNQ